MLQTHSFKCVWNETITAWVALWETVGMVFGLVVEAVLVLVAEDFVEVFAVVPYVTP